MTWHKKIILCLYSYVATQKIYPHFWISKLNNLIGASLSEPHTSDMNGTSDCLRIITIKHGKFINSSIDNLNYTKNSQNALLIVRISITEMAY